MWRSNVSGYDRRAAARHTVESHRTASASSTAATERWTTARPCSRLSHGHPLRATQRDSVADVTKTIGIDATTLEANAALRSIVRRDTGATSQEFLTQLAQASGIDTPTREDLARIDRKRPKKGSNDDWTHPLEAGIMPSPEVFSAPRRRGGPVDGSSTRVSVGSTR